ncbi:60S ribosomal protein L37a [Cryptococcus wingfieldii CBS 7118]|uniref:60S ribosomal protein L37a n=1 Tax=Cryptococcus wingfieldii CBS 7118 TaxID=1295528 RepID=A0A1E3JBZ4_9TREE|nr:60S ribosomal protein L37a [Cryptococcus wingfieldii CBS 7118]ODN98362.1 60S ribosomal protein L37a [Cryptococcus wingfieldii CBS 7118]
MGGGEEVWEDLMEGELGWGLGFDHLPSPTTKRTKKVGVTGKYGTRYGASLRKTVKKMEITQHARYSCPNCGKVAVKRSNVGIWNCKGCNKAYAGGAYTFGTPSAATVRSTIRRLREVAEI